MGNLWVINVRTMSKTHIITNGHSINTGVKQVMICLEVPSGWFRNVLCCVIFYIRG